MERNEVRENIDKRKNIAVRKYNSTLFQVSGPIIRCGFMGHITVCFCNSSFQFITKKIHSPPKCMCYKFIS